MAAISAASRQRQQMNWSVPIWVLVLTNLLVFQLTYSSSGGGGGGGEYLETLSSVSVSSSSAAQVPNYALGIPQGKAQNLPSVRVKKEDFQSQEIYGGKGDKSHLGGA